MTHPPVSLHDAATTYADLLQLQTDLIWIYDEVVRDRHRALSVHCPGQSALLIREGRAVFSDAHHRVVAEKGDWVFIREGDRRQQISEGTRVLSIRFKLGWPGGVPLFTWTPAATLKAADFPELETFGEALYAAVQKETVYSGMQLRRSQISPACFCLIRSAFLNFIAASIHAHLQTGSAPNLVHKPDGRVRQVIARLEDHGFRKPLSQSELAGAIGLSVSQLDRLFKKEIGVTPHQYQERRRLEQAFLSLRHSSDSIKEITFALGFASPSHFSAWLRRKTLLTPSELREEGEYGFYPSPSKNGKESSSMLREPRGRGEVRRT